MTEEKKKLPRGDLVKDYKQIVWLSSYPKSGNTWLRCFIDAYLMGSVDINELIASVADDGAARALVGDGSDPSTYPVDIQILCRPMALLRLVRAFELNRGQTGAADVPLFVKTHNAHLVANGMELLPKALTRATIHLVRDPRDVALSFAKHMGKPVEAAIERMCEKHTNLYDEGRPKLHDFISSWEQHEASFLNDRTHNCLIVRYEDMKASPVEAFSTILRHAGIKPDPARVAHALEQVSLANLQKQEREKGFGESSPHAENQFFGQGLTGGWKGKIPQPDLRKLERACAPMMKRLGYEFSTGEGKNKRHGRHNNVGGLPCPATQLN